MRISRVLPLLGVLVVFGGATLCSAGPIVEVDPNNTGATAQDVTGGFTLPGSPFAHGTGFSSVEIFGTSADGTHDFYRWTHPGGPASIDIDGFAPGGAPITNFDTMIHLFDSAGNPIGTSDDNDGDPGDGPGLVGGAFNSRLDFANLAPGVYTVGVGEFFSTANAGFEYTNPPDQGDSYILNIRANVTVPEASSWAVFLMVVVMAGGFFVVRSRAARKAALSA